ncbi:hypothetical protein Prudu_007160 [Prunus dulcis]|uniref:No apical meristem-associated C-terminal domain-containing protein n=1 Tax=Prunus dulcis TaxID=3755 RepID=A0A4Y1R1D9_PRUDU|nr:hypothetical protein Prudu_007160 [Prunus dulcis]
MEDSTRTEMTLSSRRKILNKELGKWRDALAKAMDNYISGENRTNEVNDSNTDVVRCNRGGKKSFNHHHECWDVVKYCKRFIIIPTDPTVMLNEMPLRDSMTSDSPLDSPMSHDSPIEKEPRPIGRKAAKAKKVKCQDNELALQAEYAREMEYLRKKDMDNTDRETMAMDTSHMSPETK